MIKVVKNKRKEYCLHCLESSNTFTIGVRNETGMEFVLCEKCTEKLLVELTKALKVTGDE